jgi:exosome complex component RRP41
MQHADILALAGLRVDGRKPSDLRQLKLKTGVVPAADGSSYLEQGLTKVLAIVHGPHEPPRRGEATQERGAFSCRLVVAPFSGTDRKRRRAGDRRTVELESIVRQTFENVVMLDLYPRSEINAVVHVLEADGSLICTVMNAVCLALMDAGIMTTDMVTACSAGVVKQSVCQDLNQVEQNAGGAYLPVAVKSRSQEVVYMQLDSRLSVDRLEEAMAAAVDGCAKLRTVMQEHMRATMTVAFERNRSLDH